MESLGLGSRKFKGVESRDRECKNWKVLREFLVFFLVRK